MTARAHPRLALVGWIALSYLPALSAATPATRGSYDDFAVPAWAPPEWLFGPVWTTLYLLMGIAAWLVWRERGWRGAPWALGLFVVQLAFNALWTIIFFGLELRGWALAEVVLLWQLILVTLVAFRRIRPLAGWLLAPYLAWVTFAAALNAEIWRLNLPR